MLYVFYVVQSDNLISLYRINKVIVFLLNATLKWQKKGKKLPQSEDLLETHSLLQACRPKPLSTHHIQPLQTHQIWIQSKPNPKLLGPLRSTKRSDERLLSCSLLQVVHPQFPSLANSLVLQKQVEPPSSAASPASVAPGPGCDRRVFTGSRPRRCSGGVGFPQATAKRLLENSPPAAHQSFLLDTVVNPKLASRFSSCLLDAVTVKHDSKQAYDSAMFGVEIEPDLKRSCAFTIQWRGGKFQAARKWNQAHAQIVGLHKEKKIAHDPWLWQHEKTKKNKKGIAQGENRRDPAEKKKKKKNNDTMHHDLIQPHFLSQRNPPTPTIQHSSGRSLLLLGNSLCPTDSQSFKWKIIRGLTKVACFKTLFMWN